MAVEKTLEKYAWENEVYDFDFAGQDELAAGQTIVGGTVVFKESDPAGHTDLTIGTAVVQGTRIQVRLSGGTAGVRYRLEARATLSISPNGVVREGWLAVL